MSNSQQLSAIARFDELLKTEHYKRLLQQLSDDEKKIVLSSLKKLVEDFDKNIIMPLKILKKL